MRKIAITTEKGGVGKTTTATCVAVGLARKGKTVVLFDMDPQSNSGMAFGISKEDLIGKNIAQVLDNQMSLSDVAIEVEENLYLVPAASDLKDVRKKIVTERLSELRLARAIEASEIEADYIIIDCPPAAGLLNDNCYMAAEEIMAPIQMESFSAEGFGDLMETIRDFQGDNPKLHLNGIVITMVNEQLKQTKRLLDELDQSKLAKYIYKTRIPRSVRVSESQGEGKIIFDFSSNNSVSGAYLSLCDEIIAQEG